MLVLHLDPEATQSVGQNWLHGLNPITREAEKHREAYRTSVSTNRFCTGISLHVPGRPKPSAD